MPTPEGTESARDRIVRTLRERIERGDWAKGSPLPSEAALSHEFGVARGTVRVALQALQEAGLVVVITAKGRFVADPAGGVTSPSDQAHQIVNELRAELSRGTYVPGERFLSEAGLRARFGASRYTAKLALGTLAADGLIEPVHGRGYFVRAGWPGRESPPISGPSGHIACRSDGVSGA